MESDTRAWIHIIPWIVLKCIIPWTPKCTIRWATILTWTIPTLWKVIMTTCVISVVAGSSPDLGYIFTDVQFTSLAILSIIVMYVVKDLQVRVD